MVISEKSKQRVIESWDALPGDMESNGLIMFARLFDEYPFMKSIYSFMDGYQGDPAKHPALPAHAGKFMRKLDMVVHQLNQSEEIRLEDLETLGSRHPGYGVNSIKHADGTREALIFMLRRQLGDAFTYPVEDSWRRFFDDLCVGLGIFASF